MRPCGFSNPLGNTAKWKHNHLEPFPRTVWSLSRKDDLLTIASCLWRVRVCRIFLCERPGFNHCHSQKKGLLSTPFTFFFFLISEMFFRFIIKIFWNKVPVLFLAMCRVSPLSPSASIRWEPAIAQAASPKWVISIFPSGTEALHLLILKINKLRLREVKLLSRSHTANGGVTLSPVKKEEKVFQAEWPVCAETNSKSIVLTKYFN